MSLSEEEIKQLHTNFRVVRECEILDKIPFEIKSTTMKEELEIATVYDQMGEDFLEEYFNSELNRKVAETTLVSFNHQKFEDVKTAIDKFSTKKIELIVEEYKQLSQDIEEYLNGFDTKELDKSEVEEFIITDQIKRTSTFKGDKDLTISYKVLNSKEYNEAISDVKDKISSLDNISVMHKDVFQQLKMAEKLIIGLNGKKPKNVENIGAEITRFVTQRAQKLQDEIFETLNDGEKLRDGLKN